MNGLMKLGAVLTIVFLVSLLALLAELFYVLWRKQAFRRRSSPEIPPSSKEQLLYFFCLKNQSRIEPAGNPTAPEAQEAEAVVVAVDDDDVAKWQLGMYGPSRGLFTIREEEREGTETSEAENDQSVKSKTVRFEGESDCGVVKIEDIVNGEETTPFSTPCASPPYYTPSPSPTHDKYSPGNDESFVSVAVCSSE
ncbi:hypothetical protein Pint_36144 [Pistacia integerrima]|uniref:Uncharacterized protein n=1 Tax=Pistacia integerrima TaxID=434235 RepID=A0ACC0Y1N0_9ROSI|nr:hypothetical protein Pint_36144 [Pistacia integerrima]